MGACACETPWCVCPMPSLVCPLELVRDDSRVFDEREAAESFQSPWEVEESSDGDNGELGFPPSFVLFFLRKPKVMIGKE